MSAQPATDELLFTTDEAGIARIVLNRPQARNAMTFAMYQGLITCCEAITENPAVKALIITGAGDKAFAAGTDIAQFRSFNTAEDALGYERFMDRVLGSLERLRVPTIAAIAGACTGGGAAIAAACDLRVATQDARFGFPIARTLGNCLSQGNLKRLSGLIGPARVKDIIFTARLDNRKTKLTFGAKARMLDAAEVEAITGHPVGGVCPFGLRAPLPVYCDLSLKAFDEVVPAAGSTHSSVRIAPSRMAELTDAAWIDVCAVPA